MIGIVELQAEVRVTVNREPTKEQLVALQRYMSVVSKFTRNYSKPLPEAIKDLSISCEIQWATIRERTADARLELVCDLIITVNRTTTAEERLTLAHYMAAVSAFTRDYSKPLPKELDGISFSSCLFWNINEKPCQPMLLHSQQGECQAATSMTTVNCPHCKRRVDVDSKGGRFTCCFCQGVFTFTPGQQEQYQPPSPASSQAADHGYRLVSTGYLPSYRQCEWCGQTFDASQGVYNHVIHGWFSSARFGYFCSPKCVREADINGFGGTPHQ